MESRPLVIQNYGSLNVAFMIWKIARMNAKCFEYKHVKLRVRSSRVRELKSNFLGNFLSSIKYWYGNRAISLANSFRLQFVVHGLFVWFPASFSLFSSFLLEHIFHSSVQFNEPCIYVIRIDKYAHKMCVCWDRW